MRMISLLIVLVLVGLMLMKYYQVRQSHQETFEEQKMDAVQQYEKTKEVIENYRKQRAKGMDIEK